MCDMNNSKKVAGLPYNQMKTRLISISPNVCKSGGCSQKESAHGYFFEIIYAPGWVDRHKCPESDPKKIGPFLGESLETVRARFIKMLEGIKIK